MSDASLLQAILSTAVEGMITIDERGGIESVNSAAAKLFGYTATELIGSNVKILMPSSFRDAHDGYLENYRKTGVKKIIGIGRDVIGKRKDGTEFPMSLAVSEFHHANKRMFAGFIRDLTERRDTEELEQGLGRIVEESLNEIYIFDTKTLRFVQVNRGARENLGYSMDELREMTPVDIKPDFTPESFAKTIAPLLSGVQEQLAFETVHQRKDGSLYNVRIHLQTSPFQGKPCFVTIVLDITEQKKSEDVLRVQRRAMESAANGVLITDPTQDDNPIVYVNPAMQKITGYSSEEVLGRNCRFLQNDLRDQDSVGMLRIAIKEERECTVVLRNFRKDGTPFWNELTVSPVRDSEGKLTHFVGIQSDITERKMAEEALARMNEELEQRVEERTTELKVAQEQLIVKEKLATLGQLAGGVAHEIRNPLGVIRNAVYFLQQTQTNANEETTDALSEISRALGNSERIIRELLDYARGPNAITDRTTFSLEVAVNAALEMIKLPPFVTVTRNVPSNLHIHAERGQIERLLANLFQNACQAMSDDGILVINCKIAEDLAVTEVTDNGKGIAPDDLEKVFEPLFTKREKGIGLGLSLSRRYAEQNGGTLTLQSELGKGSTFTLTLPLATSSSAQ